MEIFFPKEHCKLDSHLLPTSRHISYYKQGALSRKVNHINNCVWDIVKCIGASLEDENDDLDKDLYMLPSSLSKPILQSWKLRWLLIMVGGVHAFCWIAI
jgi:hypothetical protein